MSKRVRILFTTSNFNTAGSGKVIYDLINGLDATKFDIEIACGSDEGDFFKTIESLGVPIRLFETKTSYKPYFSLFYRIKQISRFLKSNRYDLVHSWQWSNDWTEAMAARMASIKWIYTKKAMGFSNRHWKIKSYLADYIITINDEMQDYFPNKEAQQLIPLGIDTDYYSPEHFVQKQPNQLFQIITVANLVPVKGVEVLIRAIHKLNDSDIILTVLGDNSNEYAKTLDALCQSLGITDKIVFIGKQADVRPYLAASDLYVIPTLDQGRKEGMPMALVEAMSLGIPVLGSDISGIRFVLKDFPDLLFYPNDVEDLTGRIKKIQLLSHKERQHIGRELRAYCISNFSMDVFIISHEQLYQQLLN